MVSPIDLNNNSLKNSQDARTNEGTGTYRFGGDSIETKNAKGQSGSLTKFLTNRQNVESP